VKRSLAYAVALVRLWTRFCTRGLSWDIRESRLEEIESDLWELQHDPVSRGVSPAVHVLARLVMGVPSDVWWRFEQASVEPESFNPRVVLTAAAVLFFSIVCLVPVWHSRSEAAGRSRVAKCAESFSSLPPLTRPDYRMRVITCAGAFFVPRDSTSMK
jgi:hypothetical protein